MRFRFFFVVPSVSRADDEAARNASTSVCLVSDPSLLQCLHFSSPDLLSRCQSTFSFVFLCFSRLRRSSGVPCVESIIFHPFHVTEPSSPSLLFWILSIIVSSCSTIFLTVSFLTFCSLETPSIFLQTKINEACYDLKTNKTPLKVVSDVDVSAGPRAYRLHV